MTKFSVIIPCYNHGQYLSEAIDSVLSQTHKPHEVIVVNDGSPDDTRYVAMQYQPQVKYIEQTNRGLSSARNTGIMNATGDFIFPLDADDMMTEGCLQRIADTITENPDADVVSPSFRCFGKYTDTIILGESPKIQHFRFEDGKPTNRVGYFSAIKRDALLEVGGYSPKMAWGWEDLHLWITLLHAGKKIVTIPEPLVLYRTKEHSMIHEANAHATELTAQILKDFPDMMQ